MRTQEAVISIDTTPKVDPIQEIRVRLRSYQQDMRGHPIGRVIRNEKLPQVIALEFATLQYIDSVLWVPMLALMKDRVSSPRLRKALTDNLLCEAGATHTSHITLCREFVESIGILPSFGDYRDHSELATHPVAVMNSVSALSEEEIAGWILAAETLVPDMFAMFLPAFEKISGSDLTYLREHIGVDSEEHSQWMLEAARELIAESGDPRRSYKGVLSGLDVGARVALSIPDALYAKTLRLNALPRARV